MTGDTAGHASNRYVSCIKSSDTQGLEPDMIKLIAFAVAFAMFVPVAAAALNQAALIVA